MMMFMNVAINGLDMQKPMQDGVEKIINYKNWDEWENTFGKEAIYRQASYIPIDIRFFMKI